MDVREKLTEDGKAAAARLGYQLPEDWYDMAVDWWMRHNKRVAAQILDGKDPTDVEWRDTFRDLEFQENKGSGADRLDRVRLWAHIVSEHACVISPEAPLSDLVDYHEHEHDGPGTIRNHPRESRHYALSGIGETLLDCDD